LIQTLLVDHPALPPPSFKILTFVIFLSYWLTHPTRSCYHYLDIDRHLTLNIAKIDILISTFHKSRGHSSLHYSYLSKCYNRPPDAQVNDKRPYIFPSFLHLSYPIHEHIWGDPSSSSCLYCNTSHPGHHYP
jgi:hypothetical protein